MRTKRDRPVYVAGETPDGLLLTHDPDVPGRSTLVWFEGQPADRAVTVESVIESYGDVYDVLMYVEPEIYDGPASIFDTETGEGEAREAEAFERRPGMTGERWVSAITAARGVARSARDDYASSARQVNFLVAGAAKHALDVDGGPLDERGRAAIRALVETAMRAEGIEPRHLDHIWGLDDWTSDGPSSRVEERLSDAHAVDADAHDALERVLVGLPGVAVDRAGSDELIVDVGGGVPRLTLRPSRVVRSERCPGPTGGPAVRLHLADEGSPPGIVVYVAPGEVAFPPDEERGRRELSRSSVPVHVSDLPPAVSYHEMVRDFGTVFGTSDYDRAFARVQMCASFWWGARRAGLDVNPLRSDLDELLARLASM